MTSMIYGVSNNGKIGLGYDPPKHSKVKYKPTKTVIKPKALYSYFTYGCTYNTD